jgi:hypothetical protein
MSSRLSLAMSASALVIAGLGSTPVGHAVTSALPRNSVGTLQLKRNAVGPQKVAPNAIRSSHVLDGSLLATDFKAGQIPQGQKGDKGDPGEPGVSARQVVVNKSSLNSNSQKSITATCPAGKVSIGGGGFVGGTINGTALTGSGPSGTGWAAYAQEVTANPGTWTVEAWAVCAKVAP